MERVLAGASDVAFPIDVNMRLVALSRAGVPMPRQSARCPVVTYVIERVGIAAGTCFPLARGETLVRHQSIALDGDEENGWRILALQSDRLPEPRQGNCEVFVRAADCRRVAPDGARDARQRQGNDPDIPIPRCVRSPSWLAGHQPTEPGALPFGVSGRSPASSRLRNSSPEIPSSRRAKRSNMTRASARLSSMACPVRRPLLSVRAITLRFPARMSFQAPRTEWTTCCP